MRKSHPGRKAPMKNITFARLTNFAEGLLGLSQFFGGVFVPGVLSDSPRGQTVVVLGLRVSTYRKRVNSLKL